MNEEKNTTATADTDTTDTAEMEKTSTAKKGQPPPTKKRSRTFQPDDPFTHTEFVSIHGVDYLLDRSSFYIYEFYAPYAFIGRMNEHGHILKKFQPPKAMV